MPHTGILDHMATLALVLWGSSILFSIMAAPIYTPTNSIAHMLSILFLSHILMSLQVANVFLTWVILKVWKPLG